MHHVADVVQQTQGVVCRKDKGVIDSLALQGLSTLGNSPEDMAKDMRRLYEQWGPIVKRIGFTAES
jgi:hypothetical protein